MTSGTPARPIASVLIHACDHGPELVRAVRHALSQTQADVEAIVVDDACAEPVSSRLAGLLERDPRLRLIVNPERLGPGASWELAADGAAGEWLFPIDGATVMNPRRIEALIAAANASTAALVTDASLAAGGRPAARGAALRADLFTACRAALRGEAGELHARLVAAARKTGLGATHAAFPYSLRETPAAEAPTGPLPIVVVSRQRIVGPTNGSSIYLLGLCRALKAAGHGLHLVQPSPGVFGRWPFLVLQPEMAVFDSHALRGALRVGRVLFATRPAVWLAAAREVIARSLRRLGLPAGPFAGEAAPYSVSAPITAQDVAFVAARAPAGACKVLADYAFQNEFAAYVPGERGLAVVMHDLFSGRAALFDAVGAEDSTTALTPEAEIALLGAADLVVAIQAEEAAKLRAGGIRADVVVAPIGVRAVDHPQPGEGEKLLFVGSKTPANLDAVEWFLREAWPTVVKRRPGARLDIAGSVAAGLGPVPEGVNVLGLAPDLAPLYAEAAVVISPLRLGSGLKIKLVEAMAHGKAIVATPVTLQGVEDIVGASVVSTDDPRAFAEAVIGLLGDEPRRAALAADALSVAAAHFSEEGASAEVVRFFAREAC